MGTKTRGVYDGSEKIADLTEDTLTCSKNGSVTGIAGRKISIGYVVEQVVVNWNSSPCNPSGSMSPTYSVSGTVVERIDVGGCSFAFTEFLVGMTTSGSQGGTPVYTPVFRRKLLINPINYYNVCDIIINKITQFTTYDKVPIEYGSSQTRKQSELIYCSGSWFGIRYSENNYIDLGQPNQDSLREVFEIQVNCR